MLSLLIAIIGGGLAVDGSSNGVEFILLDRHQLPTYRFCQQRHCYNKKTNTSQLHLLELVRPNYCGYIVLPFQISTSSSSF